MRNDGLLGVGIITVGISGALDSDSLVLAAPQEEASDELRAYPRTARFRLRLPSFATVVPALVHLGLIPLLICRRTHHFGQIFVQK